MTRVILISLALSLCGAVNAQSVSPSPGRYFTPAALTAQMNRPNDQLALLYLMGTYDRTEDAGRSCAQRGTTTPGLLAKVFSDYLMAHPQLASADHTAAGIAAEAFTQYWPCGSASSAAAAASPPAIPADLDSHFICPESLPNDQARTDALKGFLKAVGTDAPGATVIDAMYFRRALLEKHDCRQTLQHMQAVAAAIRKGDASVQDWLPVRFGGGPGVAVAISAFDLEPAVDPRYPTERAVDTYTKLALPAPQVTNVTHTTYDTVISHNLYYCGTGRYALIENDYFLSGRQTLKDPSRSTQIDGTDVYEVDPVPPGSANAAALQSACRAIGVISAPAQELSGRYFTPDALAAQTRRGSVQLEQIYLMGTYDLTQDDAQSCAQAGTTTPALLAKVYMDYLSAHSELQHTDRTAAGVAAQAFAQYWPCRK